MRITKTVLALMLLATLALPAQATPIASYSHENVDPLQNDTGSSYTLTNNGGVVFVDAPAQTGSQFDLGDTIGQYRKAGGDDYLAVPDSVYTPNGDLTFTALVYKEDTTSLNTGYQTILATNRFRFQWMLNRDTTAGTYDVDSQRLTLSTRDTANSSNGDAGTTTNGSFMAGQWYFVALRYDQSENTLQGFIQEPSDTWAPASITLNPEFAIDDFTNFRLGTDGVSGIGSGDGFDGNIDSARFYDTALSDTELGDVLQELYVVPEPSTMFLLVLGLGCMLFWRNRRRA